MINRTHRGFTLIEILIVVVILGILAAIVVPNMARAGQDAQITTTYDNLAKVRRHLEYYKAQHNAYVLPAVTPGDGTWGDIVDPTKGYLLEAPVNTWVGGDKSRLIQFGTGPDATYHNNYGWIYDPATGKVWAASFDANDNPLPRP